MESKIKSNTASVKKMSDGQLVFIKGKITNLKILTTMRGDDVAFVIIEDSHGAVEIIFFSSVYEKSSKHLFVGQTLNIHGVLQNSDEDKVKILANSIEACIRLIEEHSKA